MCATLLVTAADVAGEVIMRSLMRALDVTDAFTFDRADFAAAGFTAISSK